MSNVVFLESFVSWLEKYSPICFSSLSNLLLFFANSSLTIVKRLEVMYCLILAQQIRMQLQNFQS